MNTIKDIKKAVITTIAKKFTYHCYEFGVVEGMEMPCFFVRVTGSGEINTKNTYKQNYSVEIVMMYGKEEKGNESKILEDIEKMKHLFLKTVQTEKKIIQVKNLELKYTGERGNIPEMTFDLEFLDSLYEEDTEEIMRFARIKEETTNGNAEH